MQGFNLLTASTDRQELEKLLSIAIQSQENERKRIAMEIHDGVGQQIIAAFYRIQSFENLLSEPELEKARVEAVEIKCLLSETVRELRRVLADLHPHVLEERGLIPAVRQQAEHLTKQTGIKCRFKVEGELAGMAAEQEAAIFRIVQEALNNIKKHACANHVCIEFHITPGAVFIQVNDDGKGFQADQITNNIHPGHLGLQGMKERADMLGGILNIASHPGKGTAITLIVPLQPQAG